MKVGTLVRVANDIFNFCGIGFVISTFSDKQVNVLWLDDNTTDRIWKANLELAQDGTWISWLEWQRNESR